jgi:hypothetical protein
MMAVQMKVMQSQQDEHLTKLKQIKLWYIWEHPGVIVKRVRRKVTSGTDNALSLTWLQIALLILGALPEKITLLGLKLLLFTIILGFGANMHLKTLKKTT